MNMATSQTTTIPCPIGGWNARDPLAAMAVGDAVVLDNFYPETGQVSLRPGKVLYATGMNGSVRTLLGYNAGSLSKVFAATSSGIYDAGTAGAVGAPVTTCTNSEWEYGNMTTSGGSFLVAVNGQDKMKLYDGAVWKNLDGASTPAVTGIATTSLGHICLHKRRFWFVENNSLNAWYYAVDSIAGALTKFPMGPVFYRGGYLVAQTPWTVDGGQGQDDYFASVTSEGELAIYQGTDPNSVDTWALVGVFYVGQPIGKRCFVKYGGDVLFLSLQGLTPLSKLLQSAIIDRTQAISNRIEGAFSAASATFSDIFGWQPIIYPDVDALIINIPTGTDSSSVQFVMNNITKAWCRFTGWDVTCMLLSGNKLFGAIGGNTYQLWAGKSDAGLPINGNAQQAYSAYGYNGQKYVPMVRPNISLDSTTTVSLAFDVDFILNDNTSTIDYNPFGVPAYWDSAIWDYALWSDGLNPADTHWETVPNPPGYLHSLHMRVTTSTALFSWTSTNIAVQKVGIL